MKTVIVTFIASLMMCSLSHAAAPKASMDIVDTAVAAGEFKTLVTAVQAAGLVATLKGPGPFTVFAPTDAAFGKLPAGTVEALLKDIPTLSKILTYHVVAGADSAQKLVNLGTVKTVQGEQVEIRGYKGEVYINDARLIMGNIQASNGIIQVIDTVLLPK